MKKLYFGIALLALAVAFSGCKKDKEDPENPSEGGETLTSLSIEPASLTMTAGESVRLDAVYAPKGAKVTLKWSSSDEEVATVASNGTVTALNNGEATINLEAGGKKASCKVKVTSWEETINFTDCFIYGYEIDSTNLVYATYKDDEWGDLKVTFADMEFARASVIRTMVTSVARKLVLWLSGTPELCWQPLKTTRIMQSSLQTWATIKSSPGHWVLTM